MPVVLTRAQAQAQARAAAFPARGPRRSAAGGRPSPSPSPNPTTSTSAARPSGGWALRASLSEEQDVRRRAPLEKSNLFNACFEPFTQSEQERELVVASGEQYSLDQVIYRSKNGRLLDVQHDMEVSRGREGNGKRAAPRPPTPGSQRSPG